MSLPAEKNWASIIEEIQSYGLTQQQIEKRTGVKQGTITNMKLGVYKRASYVCGDALINLLTSLKDKKNGVEK